MSQKILNAQPKPLLLANPKNKNKQTQTNQNNKPKHDNNGS